jgi:subtilisin
MTKKRQHRLTNFSLQKAILFLSILLLLPAFGFAAEKSYIVVFHKNTGKAEKETIIKSKGRIKRHLNLINALSVTLSEDAAKLLKKDKKIAYITEDKIYTATVPIEGNEYGESWGIEHISANLAHLNGNKGAGINIAVIDTGIDYNHEDLNDNYVDGYDFVFNDNDPYDDNTISHGTHVAGIIAAEDNGIGVIGVAPEASLFAVKVLDGGGFGLLSWIISGIEWAVNNNIDIINLSLQGGDDPALKAACDNAVAAGIIIIAAAGNTNGDPLAYPAAYDSVVAVTGTDKFDTPAYFSPIGPELDVAAPGLNIQSTTAGNSYKLLSGTSQAAPHVTGIAALYLASGIQDQNENGFINDEIINKIKNYALDLGDPGFDNETGYGLVSAICPDSDNNACDPNTIYGTISCDIQAGISVSIYKTSCGADILVATTITDENGYYSFDGLISQRYLVAAEKTGYSFIPGFDWVDIPQTEIKSYDFTATLKNN